MANKLIKRRYNELLTARNHYFKFGDFLFKPDESGKVTNRSLNNMSTLGEGITKAISTATGQLGGGLIGGGLQSGVGDTFQKLGGIASAVPGFGQFLGPGFELFGGIVNRLLGSKMNPENIAKVESNINNLNNFQSDASDFDTLSQNWANADVGMAFDDSFIGKDGWFSNKAKNKAADLRRQIDAGTAWVQSSLKNNAENIDNTQMQDLLANYAAYGGPLLFAEGGGIHIKPENRGKFTETKRRTGKTTEELTHSKNPLTRKRAIFSQNAKKWHHAFGGDLMTHGANFDTGITLVGNGGTHEENPLEGVPMGMDSEGVPNLVEEGEVIFNDYVFSKRLKVPKEVRKKYKLRGTNSLTFADAAIQMSKESEERPNDPISKAGLEDGMLKLMMAQEQIRAKKGGNKFAKGGRIGRIYAGEKGDPYSQNLALSYRLGLLSPNPEFDNSKKWFYEGNEGNPYSQVLNLGLGPLDPKSIDNKKWFTMPHMSPEDPDLSPRNPLSSLVIGSGKPTTLPGTAKTIPEERRDTGGGEKMAPTWMRYAPVYASGIVSMTDALGLTNKPDYSDAKAILEASKNAGAYNPIKFNSVSNYLTYRPFDRNFYTNKLSAESGAARRAILNTSGGNRSRALAGILAADYNAQGKMGDLFRQGEEYNLAQRQKVGEFDRATNMFNSEGIFKADQANQAAQLQARSSYLKGALAASELRQKERLASTSARSANLSNFINSLGDIGRENFSRNMIVGDKSKYYTIGPNGETIYKGAFYDLPEAEQAYISGYANRESEKKKSKSRSETKKSKGGYLTIRRK